MAFEGVTKADWKLFQKKVPEWQERYMEKLVKKYIKVLESDKDASEKFWKLDELIKKDKGSPGVRLRLEKSEMVFHLICFLRLKVIQLEDLEGFSPDLIDFIEGRLSYTHNTETHDF